MGRRQSPLPQTSLDLFSRRPRLTEQKAPRGWGTVLGLASGGGFMGHTTVKRTEQNHRRLGHLWVSIKQQLK